MGNENSMSVFMAYYTKTFHIMGLIKFYSFDMIKVLWRNRELIYSLTRRDILSRYRGSVLGVMWTLFNPIMMLAVYTFVFGAIFKSRWPGAVSSETDYALLLFLGLIVFNIFADSVSRSTSIIVLNNTYVKKIVFPLETLPAVVVLSSLFHASLSFIIWLLAFLYCGGKLNVQLFSLPVILIPYIMLIIGLCWFCASLGVFLRDLSQLIGMITQILMYMCPLFYPMSAVPSEYQIFLIYNPITPFLESIREIAFMGSVAGFRQLLLMWFNGYFICLLGYVWFKKTSKGFADVI